MGTHGTEGGYDVFTGLGPDVVDAIGEWQRVTGWRVRMPAKPWRVDGRYTGSMLIAISVERPGTAPRKLILKVCPPSYGREPGAHAAALADAPPSFAKAHLVAQPFDPWPLPDGGALIFQEIAGGSLQGCGPITDLSDELIVPAIEAVAKDLVVDWNGGCFERITVQVGDLLQSHLRQYGYDDSVPSWVRQSRLAAPDMSWITTPDDVEPLPNAHLMAQGKVGACTVDVLVGRIQGDLHAQNVLVERKPETAGRRRYWLIDLSAYKRRESLAHDSATLLLSVIAHRFDRLSTDQREALLSAIIKPGRRTVDRLPGMLQRLVRKIGQLIPRAVDANGWADEWRSQVLVAIQGCAFAFTGYADLAPECRWWCFRLAGHAGREFLRLHGRYEPHDPQPVGNPFCLADGPRSR